MTVNKRYKLSLLVLFFFILGYGKVHAAIKLPAIFSNGMVLQQQSKVTMWGSADPGEKISIKNSWSNKKYSVTADVRGNWKIKIHTAAAGGPFTIIIQGKNIIQLKDVLLGEVWFCSGQSNMVKSLKGSYEPLREISSADLPSIRYYSVKRQYGSHPFTDAAGSVWQTTSAETAGSFSAVAYYFAKKIHTELNVPVGIIYAAWGGTPAEAWTPPEVLQNEKALNIYIKRWNDILKNVGKDSVRYHMEINKWKKDSTSAKKPAEPQTLFYYKRPWREPGVLFNGMINPVILYTIQGVLWYQGESNVSYADEYYHLFSSMINSWRDRWGQKDLSFYFVQLPPFGYSSLHDGAQVREAQYQVMQNIPGTDMAVTMDIGDMKDIHPTRKKEVGDRLAGIALANSYGKKNIIYKGPECKKAFRENDKVILEFEPSPSALSIQGELLKGFEIGYNMPGTDTILFSSSSARIEGNKIIVWNEKIKLPVEVRYGWLLAGQANLFNKKGLPAFPFRKKIE